MSTEKISLRNRLIDGFLYIFLDSWKSEEEIFVGILAKFGEEVCQPTNLAASGVPKYQTKVQKCLAVGLRNQIYELDEATKKYRTK